MIHFILVVFMLLGTANVASAAYCAMYFNGTRSCGIPSLEMCRQAVTGVGGTCQQDFTDQIPPNMIQRMRSRSQPPAPPPPPQRVSNPPPQIRTSGTVPQLRRTSPANPLRPLDTSPCMSLSGDTCGTNYLH